MILKQVKFKGLVVNPWQIKDNKCYYFKNGKIVDFEYRLTKLPNYHVSGEGLYMDSSTTKYNELTNSLIMSSLHDFNVKNDILTING